MTPDLLVRLTQGLLDCVCEALEQTTCGCPGRAFLSAGNVAWDQCCATGQLWVGVDRLYAYDRFPTPATGIMTCAPPLAVDITIGILRCAPTLDEQGNAPTAEKLTLSAAQVQEDQYAITNGVICCLSEHSRLQPWVLGGQRPLGPQGACVGSELKVIVALVDPPPGCRDC